MHELSTLTIPFGQHVFDPTENRDKLFVIVVKEHYDEIYDIVIIII